MVLNEEQLRAYGRYIQARDRVKLVKTAKNIGYAYIPHRDYLDSVSVKTLNHPLFIVNDEWIEYTKAALAWWEIEPRFRHEERLRASRGDYDTEDDWNQDERNIKDMYQILKEDK